MLSSALVEICRDKMLSEIIINTTLININTSTMTPINPI